MFLRFKSSDLAGKIRMVDPFDIMDDLRIALGCSPSSKFSVLIDLESKYFWLKHFRLQRYR